MELHPNETAEQRETRELAEELVRLGTIEGQASEFGGAIKEALTVVNRELAAKGLQPNIRGVVQSLTTVLAEFVAMNPSRSSRRMMMVEIEHNLGKLVALRTSVGVKSAKEIMAPDPADKAN